MDSWGVSKHVENSVRSGRNDPCCTLSQRKKALRLDTCAAYEGSVDVWALQDRGEVLRGYASSVEEQCIFGGR